MDIMSPQEEYILVGGFILQVLSIDQMELRKYYFSSFGGNFVQHLHNNLKPYDLIQVCKDSFEVLVSRDNLHYTMLEIPPEEFSGVWNGFMEGVYKQTQPKPEEHHVVS